MTQSITQGYSFICYPVPPWKDVIVEAGRRYTPGSPEWFAQMKQKFALDNAISDSERRWIAAAEQIRQAENPQTEEEHIDQVAAEAVAPDVPIPGGDTPDLGENREAGQGELKVLNGVLDDEYLYFKRGDKFKKIPAGKLASIDDLFQLCLDQKLATIWVMAGSRISAMADQAFIESAQKFALKNPQYEKSRRAMCTFVMAWKKKDYREARDDGRILAIGFAEHSRWEFKNCQNPLQMLGAISYLEDAIGISLQYSPSAVGKRLMEKANQREGRKAWLRPIDARNFPKLATRARPLIWERHLTIDELAMPAIVVYDKNSQFPAACTKILLGSGEPQHIFQPDPASLAVENPLPGIYKINVISPPVDAVPGMPDPTDGYKSGWFWAWTTKYLIERGYQIDIEEGYQWDKENSHMILRRWAERLWDARCWLDSRHQKCKRDRYHSEEARKWAYESVKLVLNAAMGLLAHPPENQDWLGAFNWYRPDWDHLIVDRARYVMHKQFDQIYRDHQMVPVGCDADCPYYASMTFDHETAIPNMMRRRDALGGYKRKYSKDLETAKIGHWFGKMRIAKINTLIKQEGWE